MHYYVLLPSSLEAMKLHRLLGENNIKSTLAPTPREANHCCGVAVLYFDENDRGRIEKIIEDGKITIDEFYDSHKEFDPSRNKFC